MKKSSATSVDAYLEALPPGRRAILATVRDVLARHMPEGYVESVAWGAICWSVPLERYPNTYNGRPLVYVSLGSQKSHCSLYLMSAYGDPGQLAKLEDAFRRAGKRLDMGKACVRFKTADDLPLADIGRLVAGVTPDAYIRRCEALRAAAKKG